MTKNCSKSQLTKIWNLADILLFKYPTKFFVPLDIVYNIHHAVLISGISLLRYYVSLKSKTDNCFLDVHLNVIAMPKNDLEFLLRQTNNTRILNYRHTHNRYSFQYPGPVIRFYIVWFSEKITCILQIQQRNYLTTSARSINTKW